MTKAEFAAQFKRLRVAGYRLPVFDGVTVKDVTDEWYGTFANCSAEEFAQAIDRLKQRKTDTFWPATGELWAHIFEIRKARRIRAQVGESHEWPETPATVRQELAGMFRGFAQQLAAKMTIPEAPVQVAPDHVLLEQEERDRDAEEVS